MGQCQQHVPCHICILHAAHSERSMSVVVFVRKIFSCHLCIRYKVTCVVVHDPSKLLGALMSSTVARILGKNGVCQTTISDLGTTLMGPTIEFDGEQSPLQNFVVHARLLIVTVHVSACKRMFRK